MVETSAPIATIDVTSESTPVSGTSGPAGTASGETDTVVSTGIVETSAPVIIPGETDDDVSTAQPDDTTAGNVGPGVVVDAGPDAGVDAGGFIDDTNDDGCDCRVGARPRSNAASLLALGLLGLVFVRIRQRRKS
jgi:MYXO-CTERM domain-containing protein